MSCLRYTLVPKSAAIERSLVGSWAMRFYCLAFLAMFFSTVYCALQGYDYINTQSRISQLDRQSDTKESEAAIRRDTEVALKRAETAAISYWRYQEARVPMAVVLDSLRASTPPALCITEMKVKCEPRCDLKREVDKEATGYAVATISCVAVAKNAKDRDKGDYVPDMQIWEKAFRDSIAAQNKAEEARIAAIKETSVLAPDLVLSAFSLDNFAWHLEVAGAQAKKVVVDLTVVRPFKYTRTTYASRSRVDTSAPAVKVVGPARSQADGAEKVQ